MVEFSSILEQQVFGEITEAIAVLFSQAAYNLFDHVSYSDNTKLGGISISNLVPGSCKYSHLPITILRKSKKSPMDFRRFTSDSFGNCQETVLYFLCLPRGF